MSQKPQTEMTTESKTTDCLDLRALWEERASGGRVAVWPSRERQALEIAYRELKAIGRLAGFKKSTAIILAKIEGLVPELLLGYRRAMGFWPMRKCRRRALRVLLPL